MSDGTVEAIYVASRAKAPMVAVAQVRAVPGKGLDGDRYHDGTGAFSRWPDSGRAVTLIESEVVEAIARQHAIDLRDGRHRRNLLTRGVRLADLLGRRFRVGGALLRGSRLCAPCRYLERLLVAPGTYDAMLGRGGLRADVVEEGELRVGDPILAQPIHHAGSAPAHPKH